MQLLKMLLLNLLQNLYRTYINSDRNLESFNKKKKLQINCSPRGSTVLLE